MAGGYNPYPGSFFITTNGTQTPNMGSMKPLNTYQLNNKIGVKYGKYRGADK